MSADYFSYVGPYIKLKQVVRPSLRQINACNNAVCDKYKKQPSLHHWGEDVGKFCRSCGSLIIAIAVEEMVLINFNELLGVDKFYFVEDNRNKVSFALYNKKNAWSARNVGNYDIKYKSLTDINMTDEIEIFRATFADDIKKLQEAGADPVVDFGHLTWLWC
jgi:hypothetical protein